MTHTKVGGQHQSKYRSGLDVGLMKSYLLLVPSNFRNNCFCAVHYLCRLRKKIWARKKWKIKGSMEALSFGTQCMWQRKRSIKKAS